MVLSLDNEREKEGEPHTQKSMSNFASLSGGENRSFHKGCDFVEHTLSTTDYQHL